MVHHTQESEGPFPWRRKESSTPSASASSSGQKPPCDATNNWELRCHKTTARARDQQIPTGSPRLMALTSQCQTHAWLAFKLCDLNASAGKILDHCIRALQTLFQREEPLIFKIGFTHCPLWRWQNDVYGYARSKEKWSNLLVIHYAHEPYTCAMLEAALIEKYKSN